ncbi:MAG: hypothetical protein FJ280_25080 [Planctomycetes bacterium]|nr:hypothetical protein [Planctomycetota bacterium]
MREVHGYRLADHVWSEVAAAAVATVPLLGDEGVLTGAICRRGTPLPVNGRTYHPLLFGYPDENGIDMLWLSDDGRLLMSECKPRCVKPAADLSEVSRHFVAFASRTLSSMLDLCRNRAHHQSPDAVSRLQRWFQSGVRPDWTFGEIADRGRLQIGIVYEGPLPSVIELTGGLPVVVASFQFNENLDTFVVDAGMVGDDIAPSGLRAAVSDCAKPHEAQLQKNRATSKRVHRSVESVIQYYMELPDTMPARTIVSTLLTWPFSPAAGTGTSEPYSLSLRIRNHDGKLVPFIWFHHQAKMHVQPNIRSYCVDGRYETGHAEMNRMFVELGRLPTAEPTGRDGLNFQVARFAPADIDKFLGIVKAILNGAGIEVP